MTDEQREELAKCLSRMQRVSDLFYTDAVKIHNHGFIEFTGLINTYIEQCREAVRNGQDFRFLNKHNGQGLELKQHQLNYLNEKLECIYNGQVKLVPVKPKKERKKTT